MCFIHSFTYPFLRTLCYISEEVSYPSRVNFLIRVFEEMWQPTIHNCPFHCLRGDSLHFFKTSHFLKKCFCQLRIFKTLWWLVNIRFLRTLNLLLFHLLSLFQFKLSLDIFFHNYTVSVSLKKPDHLFEAVNFKSFHIFQSLDTDTIKSIELKICDGDSFVSLVYRLTYPMFCSTS